MRAWATDSLAWHTDQTTDLKATLSEMNKELLFAHLQVRGLIMGGVETYGIVNVVRGRARCVRAWVGG